MKLNKSASRAIDILVLLSQSERALTQLDISNALGIPKSSTFDLIYTLMEKGVIEFDNEELRTFKLSMKLFEIGTTVLQKIDLYEVSRPFLEMLSEELKETVFLGIENRGEIVYLDRVDRAVSSITTAAGIGMRRPVHCTGLGKAILATYPSDRVIRIWNMADRSKAYTPTTICTYEAFLKDLQETRKRGYAIDNRERENEIFCIAVPIYGINSVAIAAISVATLYLKMDEQRIAEYSNKLINVAMTISRRLGYTKRYLYESK